MALKIALRKPLASAAFLGIAGIFKVSQPFTLINFFSFLYGSSSESEDELLDKLFDPIPSPMSFLPLPP